MNLRYTGLVVVLTAMLMFASPTSQAAAQSIDCSDTTWEVSDASQLGDAVTCWHETALPGEYVIVMEADIEARPTILAKPDGYHLTIEGGGFRLGQGLALRDADAFESGFFGFRITNVTMTNPSGWALDLQTQVGVELDSVLVDGGERGVLSLGPLYVYASEVTGLTESFGALGALDLSGPTLIEDTIIKGNQTSGIAIDGGLRSIPVVIRRSIVVDNQAGVLAMGGAEFVGEGDLVNPHPQVVIESSSIIDNDRVSQRGAGVIGGDVTILNSTISSHDGPEGFGYGVVALDGAPGITVANSTISGNAFDLVGTVTVTSSIVTRCERPALGAEWGLPEGLPLNGLHNEGECFGVASAEVLPLFRSCGAGLPCGHVMALDAASPALGTGRCSAVPILNPEFLQRHPIDDPVLAEDGIDLPPIVVPGQRLRDQLGAARFSCDVGALEFFAIGRPDSLTVMSWRVDALICADFLCPGARAYDVVEVVDENFTDIAVLHEFERDRFAGGLDVDGQEQVDAIDEELRALGPSMHWRFFAEQSMENGHESGTLILSRRPVLADRSHEIGEGGVGRVSVHELVIRAVDEPVRILALDVADAAQPCSRVENFLDWYRSQDPLTTVVSLQGDQLDQTDCWAELAATFVMACAAIVNDACTSAPGAYLAHDPVGGSGFTRGFEQATVTGRLGIEASPVTAGFILEDPVTDIDADGLVDAGDNCPLRPNTSQADVDTDGIGDECDGIFNGDTNCDAERDIIDALLIAQFVAGVRVDADGCPLSDIGGQIQARAGDVNRDRVTDIIDALLVAQCAAGLVNEVCPAP